MALPKSLSLAYKYASFFDFPLFPNEANFWLVTPETGSIHRARNLTSQEIIKRRLKTFSTIKKITLAKRLSLLLRLIPNIELVAVTGSVAAKNASEGDDIDLLIVTSSNTLWITRPFVLLLISFFFRRRHPHEDPSCSQDAFCPNLWLDTSSLKISSHKQNLYTAHEVLQVHPLLNRREAYEKFLHSNSWAYQHLANAAISPVSEVFDPKSSFISILFAPFNTLFFLLQWIYMYPKKTTETVTLHSAFLHTSDYADRLNLHLSQDKDI